MSYFILGCVMFVIGALIGKNYGKRELHNKVIDAITPEFIKIKELIKRVEDENLKEFIASTNEQSSEEDREKATKIIDDVNMNNGKLEIIKLVASVI